MPPQTKTSKLAAKYGQRLGKAIENHADDETTYGFIRLPGGIARGVAQLKQCYFEEYKEGEMKGEMYFRAVGVVLEPNVPIPSRPEPNAPLMLVQNLTTSIMIPVCDAKRYGKQMTMDENVAEIMLHMRRLGGDTFTEGATLDDLEELAAQLEEMAPYFLFSTDWVYASKDKPEENGRPAVKKGQLLDMINEKWHGTRGLEDYEPPAPKQATVKAGGAASQEVDPNAGKQQASANGKGQSGKSGGQQPNPVHSTRATPTQQATPPKGGKNPPKQQEPEPEPEPEPETNEEQQNQDEEIDLEALAADAADTESETTKESGERLIELGNDVGLEDDWLRDADTTWDMIVETIREKQQEQGGDGDDQGGDDQNQKQIPQVGEQLGYHPIDPRTKKAVPKPVKCEIVSVNEEQETVNLRAGKASYKDIPWDQLVEV